MLSVEKDFEGILENTDEILKSDSSNFGALSWRAMALDRLERYGEALECLNMILEMDASDKYYSYFKIEVLVKLNRAMEAYDFYKGLDDDDPHKEVLESLAHALIDVEEYDKALECLDNLNDRNWLFNYRIVDGYKRIANHTHMNVSDRYGAEYYRSWIDSIKSKSKERLCPICQGEYENQFSMCDGCGEEILMSSEGTHIECDDIKVYYYICDKLHTLKEFLKKHTSLKELHSQMDCLEMWNSACS
jgi:tetratricopeptide (TPR) repeat protein